MINFILIPSFRHKYTRDELENPNLISRNLPIPHKLENGEEMKYCRTCNLWFPLRSFGLGMIYWDRLSYECKSCHAKSERCDREKDPERIKARDRKYHSNNATEINKKEKIKRKERPEVYRKYDRKQYEKMRADVGRRLSKNISNSLWYCLGNQKNRKAGLKILSLTKDEITDHFELLFSERMSWDNYGKGEGKWSEDHIVPIIFFRFTSSEDWEFKKCWNLSNLRPMWDIENSRKKGSLNLEIQQSLIKEVLERRRELCAVLPS